MNKGRCCLVIPVKLFVVKLDGRRERFDLGKLRDSVLKALDLAGLASEADSVIESILAKLSGRREVTARDLADVVESEFVARIITDTRYEKAARYYVLGRIYNHVYGKGGWGDFHPEDLGFTYSALRVLYQRYLLKDPRNGRVIETPKMLFMRVAENIAKGEDPSVRNYWAEKFYELMITRRFIPNSPTLMNAGTKLGILSACFVIPVRDAMVTEEGDGIYDAVRAQAIVFQQGGGCGFNFSELRPESDVVASTSGVASGPLSFMKIFDVNTDVIKQGGRRRGANMGVLHVWHADIRKFIKAKTGDFKDRLLQNFNISVGMYDYFIEALKEGKEIPLINPRKTSVNNEHNSRYYAAVWARHSIKEEWVQEVIINELEKNGGSIPLEKTLLITWDEALTIAEKEGAIQEWADPIELFDEITKSAWEGGDPGLLFIDTINRRHPTWYLGKINATNPCVAGDTKVLTPNGWVTAEELFSEAKKKGISIGVAVDEKILGEDGEPTAYRTKLITATGREIVYRTIHDKSLKLLVPKASEAWVWYLGKKPGLRVRTKEGYEVTVTHEHKFLTNEGWKTAEDLKVGDKIYLGRIHPAFTHVVKGGNDLDEDIAFALGWLYGDGSLNKHYVAWYFSDDDSAAEERVRRGIEKLGGNPLSHTYVLGKSEHKVQYNRSTRLYKNVLHLIGRYIEKSPKRRLPSLVWKLNPKALAAFLRGLFTADGYVDSDKAIRLTSSSLDLLKDVQIVLTQFGIASTIYERPYEHEFTYVTKDGENRKYKGHGYYELVIKGYSRRIFKELIGFENIRKTEKLSLAKTKRDSVWATVAEIEDVGLVDFYDFTVPRTHNYIANGILHHNCGEEPLLEWESCNLGSINLEKYVVEVNGVPSIDWEGLARDVRVAVRFLDDVISVSKYPIGKLAEAARRARKVGLGVMGWAHMLIRLGVPYDSSDAVYLGYVLSEWIAYNAYLESIELAREKGSFPAWDPELYRPHWWSVMEFDKLMSVSRSGAPSERARRLVENRPPVDWRAVEEGMSRYGLRNAALLSVAPTGTISIIAGTSSSIEPVFALAFTRVVTVGTFVEVNPLFLEALSRYGLDEPEVVQLVAESGTVARNPFIPRPIREVFRTAHDVEPKWHVLHQSAWQQWVDAGVSKTVNLRHDATVDDVWNVYLLAWALGCKGITVYRDKSKSQQVINFGVKLAEKLSESGRLEEEEAVQGAETITPAPEIQGVGEEAGIPRENNVGRAFESSAGSRFRITGIVLEDGDVGDCKTCDY